MQVKCCVCGETTSVGNSNNHKILGTSWCKCPPKKVIFKCFGCCWCANNYNRAHTRNLYTTDLDSEEKDTLKMCEESLRIVKQRTVEKFSNVFKNYEDQIDHDEESHRYARIMNFLDYYLAICERINVYKLL